LPRRTSTGKITRAAVWRGGGQLEVTDWELPPVGPRDALVRVCACGVCGSDLHVLSGGFPGLQPPVVLGHEPAGTIVTLGSEVVSFAEGDAVTWEPNVTCGRCFYCREGEDANLCEQRVRVSGSFADYTLVPEAALHRLPQGCDMKTATLAEPLSCALYAFERGAVRVGDAIAIVGAGTIGLLLLMLSKRAGASCVMVSDPNPAKREVARRLGADVTVDPAAEGFEQASAQLTQGRGFDVAYEAVGVSRAVQDALALPRSGGHAVLVGVGRPGDTVSVDPLSLQRRDLTVSACWVRRHTFQRAVRLLPQLPLAELLTHEVQLTDVAKAMRLLREGEALKVIVVP
jgi:2-desacetyl-2-hydroxyethyl bacteriochlorophyllide A dehydrogenase